jgi:SAM-dependent methyltransferase
MSDTPQQSSTAMEQPKPKPKQVRRMEGWRLAYYRERPDAAFWDRHWASMINLQTFEGAQTGGLGFIDSFVTQYLPREGRILEAGCGLGIYVMALIRRGYQCEGVEWADQTVQGVLRLFPDLPICQGDITKLDVPDGYYRGYISLGVMEHLKDGPEPFMREALRVLSDDGVALISVPQVNLPRSLKGGVGCYKGSPDKTMEFYQYAYPPNEFAALLQAAGFDVVDRGGYDSLKGLKDEWPELMKIFDLPYFGPRLRSRWRRWPWPNYHFGHMMMFVCRKKGASRAR